jgi:hypothetical protein
VKRLALPIVEEKNASVGADHRTRCVEDGRADLLDVAALGAEPRDRSQRLELADAPRLVTALPEAFASPPGDHREDEDGRDRRRRGRNGDEGVHL